MCWKESTLALCCLLWLAAHTKGYSLPYSPENEMICRDSVKEYYREDLKLCCSRCPPGTHQGAVCSMASDTQCKPCRERTYTSIWNYSPQCFRCPGACREEDGMVESSPCTLFSPRLCECVEGMFCVLRRDSIPSCEMCQTRTWCEPGFGASGPESVDQDTVCSPCEPGSFSSQPSSAPCRRHTDCSAQGRSVLSQGTSSSDAVCGGAVEGPPVPITPPGGGSTEPPHTRSPNPGRDSSPTVSVGELRARSEGGSLEQEFMYGIVGGIAVLLLIVGVLAAKCVQMRRAVKPPGICNADASTVTECPPDRHQQGSSFGHAPSHPAQEEQCLLGDQDSSNPSLISSSSYAGEANQSCGPGQCCSGSVEGSDALLSHGTHVSVNIQAVISCPHQPPLTPAHRGCTDSQAGVPLSQEESYTSLPPSQQEMGKDARTGVQECGGGGAL
ncbi:tumor necrosis factor receptor superfamily member 1B isoform X2 [Polyodon spathula]|uniref:tumor necrosis factor receptor superfamily member 1B isoform X2 n=2 Tax=Polyodon spathula TaxID=7913 RepID=UPI001B7F4044|nr:tumor necrosis factor receptor superfamily member 1B isoform X2 [Polyodon spathula]